VHDPHNPFPLSVDPTPCPQQSGLVSAALAHIAVAGGMGQRNHYFQRKVYLNRLKVENPEKLKEYRHKAYLKRKSEKKDENVLSNSK
jgi:hypothetical protein